jgi:hypothetical protein
MHIRKIPPCTLAAQHVLVSIYVLTGPVGIRSILTEMHWYLGIEVDDALAISEQVEI